MLTGERERKKYTLRFLGELSVALVVAFLLVELVTRFVVYLWLPPNSPSQVYDQKYLIAKYIDRSTHHIFLMGDSLMKQGIYPELLTQILHDNHIDLRVDNLAVNAGSQEDGIKYLEYLRSTGIVPDLIIWDFDEGNYAFEQRASNMRWGQHDSYLFRAMLDRPHNTWKKIATLPEDCSLFVRHRGAFKRKLNEFGYLQGTRIGKYTLSERSLFDGTSLEISRQGMGPTSSMLDKSKLDRQRDIFVNFAKVASPRKPNYTFHPEVYDLILNYCQKNKINLCYVFLPHLCSFYDQYFYKPPYTQQFFRDVLHSYREHPNVYTIDLNSGIEDLKYYDDFRHMSTYGNVKTTERLAKELIDDPQFKFLKEFAR